jgi:FkbM family methyltransferase
MLKQILKKMFSRMGYSIRRLSIFEKLLERELEHGDPFTFVQVGANDGISFDDLFHFVTKHNTSGLVIEPLSDMFERLQYNYRSFPEIKPVRVAIHPTASSVTIHRVNPSSEPDLPAWATGIGSINPDWHKNTNIPTTDMIAEEVPAIHLMDLLNQYSITRLNLLQIDVEGFDSEIIKMIDFTAISPSIIKYETPVHSENEITQLLHHLGYKTQYVGTDTIAWKGLV